MKRTPYKTRSGVQIGLLYEPPRVYEQSADMERLQSALIGRGKPLRAVLVDWSQYIGFVAVMLAVLAVANCKGA